MVDHVSAGPGGDTSTPTGPGRQPSDERNAVEADPDYRFTLANERTFLAWIRTALGMVAGAVALVHLAPEAKVTPTQRILSVALCAFSILIAAQSVRRWQQVQEHMRRGADLPRNRQPVVLSLFMVVTAVVIGALLLWFHDQI